jgi:hypothetical protein
MDLTLAMVVSLVRRVLEEYSIYAGNPIMKIFDGSSLDEKIAFEVSQKACGAGV